MSGKNVMIIHRLIGLIVALVVSTASADAWAGDKPLYQPAPSWVKPAPPIDTSKLDDKSPVILLYDNQQKLEKGQVWTYVERATRATSPQALTAIGTIQLPWQPDHGDLFIHKAEIIRGTEHIDLLKGGQPFTVLRREQQLNKLVIDGQLTATLPVEGLQVGDVLHLAISITISDVTLKGKMQSAAFLLRDPLRIGFGRQRIIWPENAPVHWKDFSGTTLPAPTTANGYRELIIPLPLVKEAEIPKDAPIRFKPLSLIEANDFDGWRQVSAIMAPLYATDGLIDPKGPIAAEIDRIKAASADPQVRAAAALQLVQDKIRYQLIALATGNYVPQTPAQTWALRYGDCKAKTLLLLAMLHQMGIEAEPVLAHTELGGLVTSRLPSAGAFNHVMVRAVFNGTAHWLDGTGIGARLGDIDDVPPFGAVLPLRTGGADLILLPRVAPKLPGAQVNIATDSSAGVNLPAPFKIGLVVRGAVAAQTRIVVEQGSKDDQQKLVTEFVHNFLPNATIGNFTFGYDDQAGTALVSATGVDYPSWEKEDNRLKSVIDTSVTSIELSADRSRASWATIPVSTGDPEYIVTETRTILPQGGAGFTVEGASSLDATLAGVHIVRDTRLTGDTIVTTVRRSVSGAEIAAADLPAERKLLADAQAKKLRAVAPAQYPSLWQEVSEAKRLHKLEPIIAVYTSRIAEKPDEVERYTDRAWLYEHVYERQKAIEDLTKALAISRDAATYLRRAALYRHLKDWPKALADASAARDLDPKSTEAISRIADAQFEMGNSVAALATLQERIDQGGDDRLSMIADRAEMLANSGDVTGAIAILDDIIAKTPGRPTLLNTRCWVKGTHKIALDSALKDCTKAIELSDDADAALDSRAMVYFQMNRLDDALTDLNAVLTRSPDMTSSLFMRGVIRHRMGDQIGSAADLAAARGISPTIDIEFKRYGITP
jgi:tetratricopeptide (TPR) repeat protein